MPEMGQITKHDQLKELLDDDHPQYHNDERAAEWALNNPNAHHTPPSELTDLDPRLHNTLQGIGINDHHDRDHAEAHQNGGIDEINVTGLSGLLADCQTPCTHGSDKHTNVLRSLFVPCGCNTGTCITVVDYSLIKLNDDITRVVTFSFKVPSDFVSFDSIDILWISPAASGSISYSISTDYASVGEVYNNHSEFVSDLDPTGGANKINRIIKGIIDVFGSVAIGDYCGVKFTRYGGSAEDTLEASIFIIGLVFNYIAEQ